MQEEIFGPILPVVTVSSIQDALEFIARRPRPLALYYFDRDPSRIRRVLETSVSGGVTVNDCIFHLPQHELPFGGVGASGMGAYHGFHGFETFSKKKGVLFESELTAWFMARFLKPPYSGWTNQLLRYLTGSPNPSAVRKVSL
jgi:acyl-CoA reductase-like NAD-dependent aldehyde dehydrogenase